MESQLSIFDFLTNLLVRPGILIGSLVGMGGAALLYWVFPAHDIVIVQAILIVVCAIIGHILEVRRLG